MAEIDDILDRQTAEASRPIDEELDLVGGGRELEPGLYPFHPIQQQHPQVTAGDRFAIMTAGGGGRAGARMLRDKGLEVDHQGGMHFSVREPGGRWMVVDPEHMEWMDFPDLAGDIGSLYGMIKGGTIGFGLGGPVGGVVGAAAGAGGVQVGRAGLGAAMDVVPTGEEFAEDIGYEAATGALAEVGGQILAPVVRGAGRLIGAGGRRAAGREFTVAEKQAEVATSMTKAELREAAQMVEPKWTEVAAGRPRVPLEEGRRQVFVYPHAKTGKPTKMVGLERYTKEMFDDKVAKELYPRFYKSVMRESRDTGYDPLSVAFGRIATIPNANRRRLAQKLFDDLTAAPKTSTQQGLEAAITALARHSSPDAKMHMVRRLAAVWGEDISGMSYREASYLLRRRMIDDDFLYREAARKSGVRDAFRRDEKGDFVRDLQGLVEDTFRFRTAQRAVQETGPHEFIRAGLEGEELGRYYMKEPFYSKYEAQRSMELAPFERGLRYRGESPTGRTLPRPLPGDKQRVRFEKEMQDYELAQEIYESRVFGQVPEASRATGKLGPLVSLEKLTGQMTERMFPKYPKGYKGPRPGFHPIREGFEGIIPREEYVKFWDFIPLDRLRSLRIGGTEIALTEPQAAVAKQAVVTMVVQPGSMWAGKMLTRLSNVLRTPRRLLKSALDAIGLSELRNYLGQRPARTLLGGTAYTALGGPGAGIAGPVIAGDVIGGVLGRAGRYMMRDVSGDTVKKAIQIAARTGNQRAVTHLTRAANALNQFGETAYRALIWEILHDPAVRDVIEASSPEGRTPAPEELEGRR